MATRSASRCKGFEGHESDEAEAFVWRVIADDGETARCWWWPGDIARGREGVLGDEARGDAGEGELRPIDDCRMALEGYEGG